MGTPYPGFAPGAINRSTPLGLAAKKDWSRSAFNHTKRNVRVILPADRSAA